MFNTDNPFHIETIFKVRPYFALVKVGHKKVAKINFDNFKTEIEAQILDTQLSQMPIKNKAIKL